MRAGPFAAAGKVQRPEEAAARTGAEERRGAALVMVSPTLFLPVHWCRLPAATRRVEFNTRSGTFPHMPRRRHPLGADEDRAWRGHHDAYADGQAIVRGPCSGPRRRSQRAPPGVAGFFFFISPLLLVVLISCIATCKPLPFPFPPNGSLNCFATAIAGWEAQRRRDGLRLLHQAHGLLLAMALLAAALHADAAPASAAPGSSFPDAYGDRARAAQLPPRKQQPQVAYALRRASATSSAHLHGATSRSFTGVATEGTHAHGSPHPLHVGIWPFGPRLRFGDLVDLVARHGGVGEAGLREENGDRSSVEASGGGHWPVRRLAARRSMLISA